MSQFNQQFITLIIDRYGLELDDQHIDSVVATWMGQYDRGWIVKAIVEALHRGRYKVKSVDSILGVWQQAGKPSCNFPPEFERGILQDLPTIADLVEDPAPPTLRQLEDLNPAIQFPGLTSEQLNPEELAPFRHHDCYRGRQADQLAPPPQPSEIERDPILPRAEHDSPFSSEPSSGVSFRSEDNVKPNHLNPHTKFDLFHTLRAIITPNNLSSTDSDRDDLDPPISYSTDLA
jgi:hypothetical protein